MAAIILDSMLMREINRCNELCRRYEASGQEKAFTLAVVRAAIMRAEYALDDGDPGQMVRAFNALKGCE